MSTADEAEDVAADDAQPAAAAAAAAAGDGLPGVAVPGHPGLRAGAFGPGKGVLGMYQITDGQDGNPDQPGFQTISWRDTDPQANAYDLYTAKRDLGEAQTLSAILGSGGVGQTIAAAGAKGAGQLGFGALAKSVGALAEPYSGAAGLALGAYMGSVETPRLQNRIKELKAHKKQFGGSAT